MQDVYLTRGFYYVAVDDNNPTLLPYCFRCDTARIFWFPSKSDYRRVRAQAWERMLENSGFNY